MAEMAGHGGLGSDEEGDYSDLEDFIVCKEGRNYSQLISREFRYSGGQGWL